jgi:hypothetical protein
MIDLHCHVLPGIDDGPATVVEAIALARGARDDGITTIAATPHVDYSYPAVDSASIRVAVQELQIRLDAAGVEVSIVPGAEVAATRAMELDDAELRALTLGGGGWLLLECPLTVPLTPGVHHPAARVVVARATIVPPAAVALSQTLLLSARSASGVAPTSGVGSSSRSGQSGRGSADLPFVRCTRKQSTLGALPCRE